SDPREKAFGGRIEIIFNDGTKRVDEIAVANAHPLGARPFGRLDYLRKFETLTEGTVEPSELARFLDYVQRLPDLASNDLGELTVTLSPDRLSCATRDRRGIF